MLKGSWGKRGADDSAVPLDDSGNDQSLKNEQMQRLLKELTSIFGAVYKDVIQDTSIYDATSPTSTKSNEGLPQSGDVRALTKRQQQVTRGWLKRPDGRLEIVPRNVNWSSLRGNNLPIHNTVSELITHLFTTQS